MFYVQSLQTGGTIFWKELHSTVMTNSFGLFTLVVGTGTRQTESTVATFSLIDWSITPKYLKTEIYYSGSWKDMGTSQLMSVPYAMTSGDLAGTVDKLAVKGTTSGLEEALFEVKNKDGQTVFAVYNEGVRVYVSDGAKAVKGGFAVGGFGINKAESTKYFFVGKDSVRVYLDTNPLTKKLKGGFAVGGYDLTKGTVQDYLDVNSDSVRIYIDSNPATKKVKGGFAVGGYDMTKGTNTNYMNVNTDASGIINPSQNRILWFPLKNAFLTGKVLVENKDSVGENSFASGYESKSKGAFSQALGYQATAEGNYSTSIGYQSIAKKENSFAFGQWAKAMNTESYSFGREARADGYRSFALGSAGIDELGNPTDPPNAKGNYSFAIGQGSISTGFGAFSIGLNNSASGDYSFAFGAGAQASGGSCMAFGIGANAGGYGSTALGIGTNAAGSTSTAMGKFTSTGANNATAMGVYSAANGFASTAMGCQTIASGYSSTAIGYNTKAVGYYSTATGFLVTANGQASTAMGEETVSNGKGSIAIGSSVTSYSCYETALGSFNTNYTPSSTTSWVASDRLFVIGNGTSTDIKSNAITILKNGRIGLQTVESPTYALELPNNSIDVGVGSGRAYAWTTYSDSRLKENQVPLIYGLAEVMELNPKQYIHHSSIDQSSWPNDAAKKSIGLVAQDVYKVIPEVVDVPPDDSNELWGINYNKIIPVLVNAIQEQQQQIESYKLENENLKSQLQTLQEEVEQIKTMLSKTDKR
jgi:hypothetical protein